MSLNEEGMQGEQLARKFLRHLGLNNLQQIDWLVKKNNNWYIIEVKMRELFNPPPFSGTGLDLRQISLRKQLYKELGIDTCLMVFEKNTNSVYTGMLSKLENTKYFDTKNDIRIYNIKHFKGYNFKQ